MDDIVVCCLFFVIGVSLIIKMATETSRKRKREGNDNLDEEEKTCKRLRCCCCGQCPDHKLQEVSDRILSSEVENQLCPKGIPNVGSTCFMSSILQCFCGSPNLDWLLANEVPHSKKDGIAKCLMKLIDSYRREEHGVPQKTVRKLLKAVRRSNPQFDGYSQQDSFELYNTIVAGIEEERCCKSERCRQGETITVSKLFTGQFMTVYFYDHCKHVDLVFQDFTSLSVPFSKKGKKGNSNLSKMQSKGVTKEQKSRKTGSVSPADWAERRPAADRFSSKEPEFSSIPESESHLRDLENDWEQKDKFDDDEDNTEDRASNHLKLTCLNSTEQQERTFTSVEKGLSLLAAEDCYSAEELPCRICEEVPKVKGKTGSCYKRMMLAKLPPVLVLHINRFEQCGSTLKKIEGKFTYPLHLDIKPFCVLPEQMGHRCTKYSLFGTVNHIGSLGGGHYYAYLKTTERNVKGIRKLLKNESLDPESRKTELIEAIKQLVNDGSSDDPESSNHDRKSAAFQKDGEDIGTDFDQSDWYFVSDSRVEREDINKALRDSNAYILMYETCEEREPLSQAYVVNEQA